MDHINNGQLTIFIIFLVSLVGVFFVKRMKEFMFSYIIFEIGLAVMVGALLVDNPWGGIAYAIIGSYIILGAFVATIITFIFLLFKKQKT